MFEVLLSWGYMSLICYGSGVVILQMLMKVGLKIPKASMTGSIVAGLIAITVYAEYFSLLYKVGAVCHIVWILLMLFGMWKLQAFKGLKSSLCYLQNKVKSRECIFFLLVIAIVAFFTSRGQFHTDTGIYHAQAIRMIEEYRCIKGLANVQLHFGYNSSYLVFCAFFTMSWLRGAASALHTTTGFLAVIFALHAVGGMKELVRGKRSVRVSDGTRVGILLYILINISGFMSPATDYGTLLMVMFILLAWLEVQESDESEADKATFYGILSVAAVFTVSMKLSAAVMVLLALYPLILLLQNRSWKQIGALLCIGFLVVLPFLIRNIILTGWLFYPFESIDLFNVAWKVPRAYSLVDSAQIKVYGRCLYEIDLVDMPIREWMPIWWSAQEHYDQMMLYAVVLSVPLNLINLIGMYRTEGNRGRLLNYFIYIVALYGSAFVWLVTAPFVRYGLSFILLAPLVAVGSFLELMSKRKTAFGGIGAAFGLFISVACVLGFAAEVDHYMMDDLLFVKRQLKEPYYFTQKRFDVRNEDYVEMNGHKIYYSAQTEEVSSYMVYPSSCYKFMIERTEMMGDRIEDGFKAK